MAKKRYRKRIRSLLEEHRELTSYEITELLNDYYVNPPELNSVSQLCRNIPNVVKVGFIDRHDGFSRLRVSVWRFVE